jgi:hypothetical protein
MEAKRIKMARASKPLVLRLSVGEPRKFDTLRASHGV